MGGGDQINKLGQIGDKQVGIADTQSGRSTADYNQGKGLLDPYLKQQSALASGSPKEALAAIMPSVSKQTQGLEGAKTALLNSMPPGPARDRALADMQSQLFSSIGGAQAAAVQEAPKNLASAGTGLMGMSMQELGAALSGLQGGASTTTQAAQLDMQRHKAMLDFFGSLAGTAAGVATGGLSGLAGGLFKGGGGPSVSTLSSLPMSSPGGMSIASSFPGYGYGGGSSSGGGGIW